MNACAWTGAVVGSTGNISESPGYLDPSNDYYHYDPASLLIDAGALTHYDFEGDKRPAGAAYDIGADEAE